jgi:4-alpha-glucanotransferase
MTDTGLIDRLSALVGIEPSYFDIFGERHDTSLETNAAVLSALGFDVSSHLALHAAIAALEEASWRRWIAPVVVKTQDGPSIDLDLFLPADEADGSWRWDVACEGGEHAAGTFRPEDLPLLSARDIDGRRVERRNLRLPSGLPLGYHRVRVESGGSRGAEAGLVLAPRRCYISPELAAADRRAWGLSGHVYTLRSEHNWGIGDFGDLARLCALAGRSGASLVATNPFHALFPQRPADASPYSPSSRLFLNPIYIDVTAVTGFSECSSAHPSSTLLSSLRAANLVDYAQVWGAKVKALEALFHAKEARLARGADGAHEADELAAFVLQGGASLEDFATFGVIEELQAGSGGEPVPWHRWPAAYRVPRSGEAARARERRDRTRFWQYLQFLADQQLGVAAERGRQAGLELGLVRDLALGINPDGADAWMQPQAFATRLRCGAPADDFHPEGQEWGVAPFDPLALRRDYSPFIALLRANMRHAAGLRIDHVIGLQRQFLVPEGLEPRRGCYVRYPLDELLAIVALESCRHRCMVIGEDLGTIPEGFRDRLRAADVFGCGVLYFERASNGSFRRPGEYHERVVATAATHDLPTLAGYWVGRDIVARQSAGIYSQDKAARARAKRDADRVRLVDALAAAGLDIPVPEDDSAEAMRTFVRAAHAFLALSSARLFVAQLDDLLGEPDQINVPGTVCAYPNWRRKLSLGLEDPALAEALEALARTCARYGRTRRPGDHP